MLKRIVVAVFLALTFCAVSGVLAAPPPACAPCPW